MKITSIESCVLTVPCAKQMALEFPHHKLVVAEIATDEGLKGLGYSLVFAGTGAESVLACASKHRSLPVQGLVDSMASELMEDATQADCTAGANVLMHTVLALAGVAS